MRTREAVLVLALLLLAAPGAVAQRAAASPDGPGGYVIETDSAVAKDEPGTHGGGGSSTGYSFFGGDPELYTVFRKRALHPGAGIGYHLQKEDEIYYFLSGTGEMTIDDHTFPVRSGMAVLTHPGSHHGLKQTGSDDLVLLIVYPRHPSGGGR
ncbi:MAG TPA: cupin domain-containing protein [Longimicrobiaceae bacterium]|nr:cupin domain-containing protein [Longimicrobiaceae bacterium]